MSRRQRTHNVHTFCILPFRVTVLTIAGILFMAAMQASRVFGAEFRMQPVLTLSEEFNDNIFLTTKDRQQDYITQAVPAVKLVYKTDFWAWDVNYAYIYRYYSGRKITNDSTQLADVKNRTELIDNTLFIALKDDYSRVSLNIARDYTQESLSVNQSDRNVFTANPFIAIGHGARTLMLGYRYVNTWYKDPAANDTAEQEEYAELSTELSSRTTLTTGVRYMRNVNDIDTYDMFDVYSGPQYIYAPDSYIYLTLGNSLIDFETTGRTSQPFWHAGITHQYSTITFSFDAGLRYIPDPVHVVRRADSYIASLRKSTKRTTLQVSGAMTEYRNAANKHLEDTSYRIAFGLEHTLSPVSKVLIGVSAERLRDYQLYVSEDVYLNRLRFEHRAAKNLTLSLEYRYSNVYSPDVYEYNYYNNRVNGELTMKF